MSHHLLSPTGVPVTPPFSTRGQHCGYMEQLRRSVEQLRHQTACKSPTSSSCSSTASTELCRRSSFSRSSDTFCNSTSATPECLVVYEPHVVVNNISQVYPGYRSSSSSSSTSSSPESKLEDVSDIFEDSGVDLGFPKQLTPRTMYPQQHHQHPYSYQQQHQQQQQQQYQHHKEKLEQLKHRQSLERLQHNENLQVSPTNSNLRHQVHSKNSCNHQQPYEHAERQHRREAFSKDSGIVNYDKEPTSVLGESNMVDKSTHTHVSEFGGVCFCAVEIRKDKNMNNQSSRQPHEETPRSSRQNTQTNSAKSRSRDNSIEPILESRRQIVQPNTAKSRDNSLERIIDSQRQTVQTNPYKSRSRDNSIERILEPKKQAPNPQSMSYGGAGSAEYRQSSMATHNSPIRSTSAGSGTHKISLTSALIGAAPQKVPSASTVLSRPTQKDNVYIDMTRNTGPLRQGISENRNSTLRDRGVNVDKSSSEDDDETPTATPTPEDDNVYISRSYLTQGCQTVKSVLNKNSTKRGVVDHRGISVQVEVHRASPDTETDVDYVKADGKFVPETDSGYSTGQNPHTKGGTRLENNASKSGVIARNGNPPHDLKRSPSVTSLISMTDTMSVTSLEVANIMAVSSKEEKKSAVKLEKERLQLQHQRLESYQHNYHGETPIKSVWTEKGRKNYHDDSLKKHKIYQSVLENLPSSTKGPESDSNLHHFVTQSLQSFFTGGGRSLQQHQNQQQQQQHQQHHQHNQHQQQEGGWGEKTQGAKTQVQQGAAHMSDSTKASSCSYSSGYMSHSSSPKQSDFPVPLPSLFQLTACFRLFHVVYGDWTDLRNIRLYPTDILLEDNSRSPSASSRSPGSSSRSSGSPGSRSVASVLSGDSGAFRSVSKGSPAGRYTFLAISSLGNHRMELDTGGLQVGDHIIEVNDMCMLNRTPEVFYSTLRKLHQVHLVIGRRRCGPSANQMASCDSSML